MRRMNINLVKPTGAVRPAVDRSAQYLRRTLGVALWAVLSGIAAHIQFYAGSPVPITLQSAVVVLAGLTLGPVLGTTSMLLYVALGLAGLPVFSGALGAATLVGPTAGYLFGFIIAQPVIGALALQRWNSWLRLAAAALAGHAIILTAGAAWLSVLNGGQLALAATLGVLPFVYGSLVKSAVAVVAARPLTRWFSR